MKTLFKVFLIVLFLGLGAGAAYSPVSHWWRQWNRVQWRQAVVEKGPIVSVVDSTGTVKPVMSVQVGSFVSGPIDPETRLVEFNQEVKKGDVLAIIDQRIYLAAVKRDEAAIDAASAQVESACAEKKAAEAAVQREEASLATRLAEIERVRAELNQSQNDERRAIALSKQNRNFVSKAEMDEFKFKRMSLEAQLSVAEAAVKETTAAILQAKATLSQADASIAQAEAAVEQAKATLMNSDLNLQYTKIKSPVSGIVIDRKIEPGQTLAASFQTPELFVIAPRMREEIHVHASVDEADIGLILEAKRRDQPVRFSVDAHPHDLFHGEIKEVRYNSTTNQNVVTYPVIITARNPDLKLLPGMTANISFHVDKRQDVVKIPNSALRFFPEPSYVRPEDQELLDGANRRQQDLHHASFDEPPSEAEENGKTRLRNVRHVWVVDGDYLRPIEVRVGISDHKFTELVSGDLKEGMKLVTGMEPKKKWF